MTYAAEYSGLGISKVNSATMTEFKDSFNKVINNIGYIQFYDISEKISVFPVNPEIVLTNIEVSALKIVSPLLLADLTYTQKNNDLVTLSSSNTKFSLQANLTLKWYYKVGGSTIYRGLYSASLKSSKTSVAFTFINNSPSNTGLIGMGWNISSPAISGFGASELISTQIATILAKKLYPTFNEELNRFNDVIVSGMVYSSFYRNILLPVKGTLNEAVYLRNVFAKFLVLQGSRLGFAFSSSIYYSIQHLNVPLVGTFVPNEADDKIISLYLGQSHLSSIFDAAVKGTAYANFVVKPEDQKAIFGFAINIAKLATFHPKLAEDFNVMDFVDFACKLKDTPSSDKKYKYACKFVLSKEPNTVVIDIDTLEWSSEFTAKPMIAGDIAKLDLAVTNFRFTDLKIKSPYMQPFATKQLLGFLQPLAKAPGKEIAIEFPITSSEMKWTYTDFSVNSNNDLSLHFTEEIKQ